MIEGKTFVCDCGSEVLVVSDDCETGIDIAVFARANFNGTPFRCRLRYAWHALVHGKPYTDQVCLSYEKAKKLASLLNRLVRRQEKGNAEK